MSAVKGRCYKCFKTAVHYSPALGAWTCALVGCLNDEPATAMGTAFDRRAERRKTKSKDRRRGE